MTGDLFQVVSRREDTNIKIPRDASDAGPSSPVPEFVLADQSWSWNVNYRRRGLSSASVQSAGGGAVGCAITFVD
jgi:hypothetical protein